MACGIVGAVVAIGLAVHARFIRGSEHIEPLWFATLLSVNALFNAYTPIYDLVLLAIGAVLTAEYLASRFGPNVNRSLIAAHLLIAIVYFGPHLSQVVAKTTSAQPFGLVLAALTVWQSCLLWQTQRSTTTLHDPFLSSVSH